jgi:hypothetical protein
MGLQIEVKDMKKTKKEDTKTLAFFKVTVSVDGEPLITLPNYRLVQTDKGLKVDSAIHEVKQAKEQGGKPEFIKCYYPFNNLNDEVLPEAEKVYKALPVKKGK